MERPMSRTFLYQTFQKNQSSRQLQFQQETSVDGTLRFFSLSQELCALHLVALLPFQYQLRKQSLLHQDQQKY